VTRLGYIFAALLMMTLVPCTAIAQLLPEGVGAYSLGVRQFTGDPSYFDGTGSVRDLGSRFNQDFTSDQMASGANGADLQKLYRGLKQYDAQSADATSGGAPGTNIADQLNFGKLRGTVKADVQAKYMAMAYGATPKWTVFFGIPFVTAKVDTSLAYSGRNNAQDVQQKLGDLAFEELQAGLAQASALSASTVKSKIENEFGYASLDHWSYKGLGDIFIGGRTEYLLPNVHATKNTLLAAYQVDLPTGHADDPDILTDTPIGKGYYATGATLSPRCTLDSAFLGGEFGLSYGFARKTKRRIPLDNETLIAANRKADVQWQPGQDEKFAGILGLEGQAVQAQYKIGGTIHTRDHYRGSLPGNYAALEGPSANQTRYHEATIQYSTVKSYAARKFAIPFILGLTAHDTLSGLNTNNVRYFELSVMSFFKVPSGKGK
jgi:hypothetical protein